MHHTHIILFIIQSSIMQSSIFALVAFGMLFAVVQCTNSTMNKTVTVAEYTIKEGHLSGGRSYEIKSKTNAPTKFSVKNELLSVGKKLILLEDNKERYIVKHDVLKLLSTWTIKEANDDKVLGKIEHKLKFIGSKMVAKGTFGHYTIHGNLGNHEYSIKKDDHKVAKVTKKELHVHDTYDLSVYDHTDPALMILFTIIVDEIRQH